MTIDPDTGVFRWTPTEAQGPGVFDVTVRVSDSGTPALDDFEAIKVTVGEVNAAPVLNPIGDQSVNEGNEPLWTSGVREVVRELKRGPEGIGSTARYIGSLVADFHRNLLYGGVFLSPPSASAPGSRYRKASISRPATKTGMMRISIRCRTIRRTDFPRCVCVL